MNRNGNLGPNREMILCIGTTPAAQRVMIFNRVVVDAVNRATTTLDGVAGKSINVAKVLQVLGASVAATGFLGGPRGRQLEALLQARNLDCEFVTVAAPTRECLTVIDEAADTVTELVEESRPVEAADFETLFEIIRRRVTDCQAVVMSGTVAGGGPADFYLRCTRLAHAAGAISVVDASGQALLEALPSGPGLVKPNRAELEATAGRALESEEELRDAMRDLHGRGAQRVVVTDGSKPVTAFDGKRFWRVLAPEVRALNPIGSGDAFTAALTWRLTQGDGLEEACRWACAAGAANALTAMAGEVTRQEVDRLLSKVRCSQLV